MSPSSGTTSGCPLGIRPPFRGRLAVRASALTSATGTCSARRWLGERRRPGPAGRRRTRSRPRGSRRRDGRAGRRPRGNCSRRRAPAVARPSVTTTSRGRRRGSRIRSSSRTRAASSSPSASGVRPPAGRSASRSAAISTESRGRQHEVSAVAAEGDQPDLVAALVGVEQQRQDRGLHLLHPLARGHRARGVDAEQDQVGLLALARRDAQVVTAQLERPLAASAGELVRGGGADRLGQVDRARAVGGRCAPTRRPDSVIARLRSPAVAGPRAPDREEPWSGTGSPRPTVAGCSLLALEAPALCGAANAPGAWSCGASGSRRCRPRRRRRAPSAGLVPPGRRRSLGSGPARRRRGSGRAGPRRGRVRRTGCGAGGAGAPAGRRRGCRRGHRRCGRARPRGPRRPER